VITALVFAYAVVTFPMGDVEAMAKEPSPHALIRLAADAAAGIPSAKSAAFALGLLAAGEPSTNPIHDTQTSLGRGGRRG
jgi:hypothetical protein